MKKSILFAMFLGGLFAANAQTSDVATLNIILKPVQTITVNTKTVDLVYDDKSKYSSGVTLEMKDHLQVFSSGGFEVLVKSKDAQIKNNLGPGTGGNDQIESSGITVTATKGTSTNAGATFAAIGAVPLLHTDQVLFGSNMGGISEKYTVTYKGAGADKYVGKHYDGTTGYTKYSTDVTYSIIAK